MSATATAASAANQTGTLVSRFLNKTGDIARAITGSRPFSWVSSKLGWAKNALTDSKAANWMKSFLHKERSVQVVANTTRTTTVAAEATVFLKTTGALAAIFFPIRKFFQALVKEESIWSQIKIAFGDWRNLHRRVVSLVWEFAMELANAAYILVMVKIALAVLLPVAAAAVLVDLLIMSRRGHLDKDNSYTWWLITTLGMVFFTAQNNILGYKPNWLKKFRAPAYEGQARRVAITRAKTLVDMFTRISKDAEGLTNRSDRGSVIASINVVLNDLEEIQDYLEMVGHTSVINDRLNTITKVYNQTAVDVSEALLRQETQTFDSEDVFTEPASGTTQQVKYDTEMTSLIEGDPEEAGRKMFRDSHGMNRDDRRKMRRNLFRNLRRQGWQQETVSKVVKGYDDEARRVANEGISSVNA